MKVICIKKQNIILFFIYFHNKFHALLLFLNPLEKNLGVTIVLFCTSIVKALSIVDFCASNSFSTVTVIHPLINVGLWPLFFVYKFRQ